VTALPVVETRYARLPNGISLAYEEFGPPDGVPVLLVMGLGTQMIGWTDEFCSLLAAGGRRVVRFDNRDIGLSTHLDDLEPVNPVPVFFGMRRRAPYLLADLAGDALALMDHLGWDSGHVVGASMGGFIAQELVLEAPERVRSLTSIMSSTGSRRVGAPRPDLVGRFFLRRRIVTTRDEAIELAIETYQRIGSPGFPMDVETLRRIAGISWDRAHDGPGTRRQLLSILASPDRTERLRQVRDVPTVVLHGADDPLVHCSGGIATARAIAGARCVLYPGMGHDLPRDLWPEFAREIGRVVADGEARRDAHAG
jgi:pimeloyl-ACP methyl ester carboxylesterase